MVSQRLEEVLSYLSECFEAKVFNKKTMEELKYLNPLVAPLCPSRRGGACAFLRHDTCQLMEPIIFLLLGHFEKLAQKIS